ncbi:hypothetical protein C8R46DRAFT_1137255 [Mycena filopes]|nr:hypothetical protein C8R46DRAFT_1149491 [Mycena filopes]KAJ7138562.1 hypothetical protein C8R46DRAFT_1137255 [Mycena filopes]
MCPICRLCLLLPSLDLTVFQIPPFAVMDRTIPASGYINGALVSPKTAVEQARDVHIRKIRTCSIDPHRPA